VVLPSWPELQTRVGSQQCRRFQYDLCSTQEEHGKPIRHFPPHPSIVCLTEETVTEDGAGALLSGDILQVASDVRRVSFLWSYPNMMPLLARKVLRIGEALAPWRFDRIYGAFLATEVVRDAKQVVARSIGRYVELLNG
jgi:hypothetical protein